MELIPNRSRPSAEMLVSKTNCLGSQNIMKERVRLGPFCGGGGGGGGAMVYIPLKIFQNW